MRHLVREREGEVGLTLAEAQCRIEMLAELGEPFEQVEAAIEQTRLSEEEKSALWLLAWSAQERGVRLRVAKDVLESLRTP